MAAVSKRRSGPSPSNRLNSAPVAELGADKQLDFVVSDTGVGIPPDKIGSIFDPFHQAQEGQAIDGTGLGLAINRRLIRLLGGTSFRVESEPGVGSRFRFRIPYQPVVEGGPDKSEPGRHTADGKTEPYWKPCCDMRTAR